MINERFLLRAYNKKTGELLYGAEAVGQNFEDLELMWCTTRRDATNILIYENDIVEFYSGDKVLFGIVEWDSKLLTFVISIEDGSYDELALVKIRKIIGNIYAEE